MGLIETYQQRDEERIAWRQHRLNEAQEANEQWRLHVAKFTREDGEPVRAYSDSQQVRDQLIADGLLLPLAHRPTLWIDPNDPRGKR